MHQILKKDWAKMMRTADSGKENLISLFESRLSGLAIKRFHIIESLRKTDLTMEKPTLWSDEDLITFLDYVEKRFQANVDCGKQD